MHDPCINVLGYTGGGRVVQVELSALGASRWMLAVDSRQASLYNIQPAQLHTPWEGTLLSSKSEQLMGIMSNL